MLLKGMRVEITAPSRLHLGLLTDGNNQRPWQGIGLAIKEPRTILFAETIEASGLRIAGNFENELELVVRKFYSDLNVSVGVNLEFIEYPPRHVGLGSGTQIILSAATAISILAEIRMSIEEIAARTNRGKYSWIGIEAFRNGGFIISLGQRKNSYLQPIIRLNFPEDWLIILSIPDKRRGLSGLLEDDILSKIKYSEETVKNIHSCVMSKVLPGIIEHNIELFGKGVESVQRLVGSEFESIQGGIFNPDSAELAELMLDAGLYGVGQSSWGPTIYGFTDKPDDARSFLRLVKDLMPNLEVYITTAENKGARVIFSQSNSSVFS